jgi:sterol desaturase/sphingolipid hydroxylase (fatty acid hydroxylase superfamily)
MLLYSWISFWLTYFIIGCLFHNDENVKINANFIVTTQNLLNTIGLNAVITFLFIPIADKIPSIIYTPNTLYGYILRIIIALIIGDLCFYWSHRLFHHPKLYFLHKKHHLYIVPTSLAGVFCSPFEMLISNHLSMVLALKLVHIHSVEMLMIESSVIALNILKSHSSSSIAGFHHAKHHSAFNCNYGFSYLTDIIFGSYVGY